MAQKIGIRNIKSLKGLQVEGKDIQVKGRYHVPSGMGGVFVVECTYLRAGIAKFKCTNKDWPYTYELDLNELEITTEALLLLKVLMRNFHSLSRLSTLERNLLLKAERFGLISIQSETQVQYTEHGANELFKAA